MMAVDPELGHHYVRRENREEGRHDLVEGPQEDLVVGAGLSGMVLATALKRTASASMKALAAPI